MEVPPSGTLRNSNLCFFCSLGTIARPEWGTKACGDYRNVFTYKLITVGKQEDRANFVLSLIGKLWASRFDIRHEAHGIPIPDDSKEAIDNEFFDDANVPLAWTKWLNLPDVVPHDAPTSEKDATVMDGVVDLARQQSRKQSPTLHKILDAMWVELTSLGTDEDARIMEAVSVKGDVSKLQRILMFVIDGFENSSSDVVDRATISRLRDIILFFVHNPTSDSASGFNASMKKRVIQWYSDPPLGAKNLTDEQKNTVSASWHKFLVRTPAARLLSKLLETRRFFARSHTPLIVSYSKIAKTCTRLFASDDPWKKAVALLFALGVRPNELFRDFVKFTEVQQWELEEAGYNWPGTAHWVMQIGTSKCANASKLMTELECPDDNEKRTAIKPILFDFTCESVISAIDSIRLQADTEFRLSRASSGLSLAEAPTSAITTTVVQKLTRTMYSAFPIEGDECTARGHLFGGLFSRKFYSCAALKEYEGSYGEVSTPNQFVSDILLHQPGLPTDSVHYVTLRLLYGSEDNDPCSDEKSDSEPERKRKSPEQEVKHEEGRKRKRARKNKRELFGPSNEDVTLKTMDPDKSKITIKRYSHRRFTDDSERMAYYNAAKSYLVEHNIKPSIANLTAIGVSPQFQSARKKQIKSAVDQSVRTIHQCVAQQEIEEKDGSRPQENGMGASCTPPTPPLHAEEHDPLPDVAELVMPPLKRQRALKAKLIRET